MEEVLHMLGGPVIFVFFVAAMRYWFIGLINLFRAAAKRKSGVSWNEAFSFEFAIFGCDIYTDEGKKSAARVRRGALAFLACCAGACLIGWLTGWGPR